MKFRGKELKTGSECYAAAMSLMKHEENAVCVRGAVELFITGAEMHDRFCIVRLKEIVREPRYLNVLDKFSRDDLLDTIAKVLQVEIADENARKRALSQGRGVFGVFANKPINRSSALSFQRRK